MGLNVIHRFFLWNIAGLITQDKLHHFDALCFMVDSVLCTRRRVTLLYNLRKATGLYLCETRLSSVDEALVTSHRENKSIRNKSKPGHAVITSVINRGGFIYNEAVWWTELWPRDMKARVYVLFTASAKEFWENQLIWQIFYALINMSFDTLCFS